MNLAINLLILFLFVIWFALIYWTYTDARRRIADPMLVGCATAASLFPFVGTIVYTIVRPPEYLEDVRERELEMQAAEAGLLQANYLLCPHCDYEVEKDFVICPSCLRRLKERCTSCGKPLDQAWTVCPYCEAQVPGAMPTPRRTRRRRSTAPEETAVSEAEPAVAEAESTPRRRSPARAERATLSEAEPAVSEAEPKSRRRKPGPGEPRAVTEAGRAMSDPEPAH